MLSSLGLLANGHSYAQLVWIPKYGGIFKL